jgi:hypothetical protein
MVPSPDRQEPTINEYLDSIRVLLGGACTKLEQDINAAESQFTRRQTGALIRKVLDIGKQHLDRNVTGTFHEMQWFVTRTSFDRRAIAESTVRELTTFLNRTKAILGSIKRHVRGGVGAAKLIDQEMRALDRSLQLKMKLGGLPDIVVPAKAEIGPSGADPQPVAAHVREGDFFAAFFARPLNDVVSGHPRETIQVGDAVKQGASGSTGGSPIRERVEDAQPLARSLHQSVSEELQRIKGERRNEGDAALMMDYLTNAAAILDQIATALGGARLAITSEQRDRNFEEAETLAANLAEAASRFAKNHSQMIMSFGGTTIFILLGAAVFTTIFGVSADLANDAPFALLNMPSRRLSGETPG